MRRAGRSYSRPIRNSGVEEESVVQLIPRLVPCFLLLVRVCAADSLLSVQHQDTSTMQLRCISD